jgi:rhomboid protease GluP
LEGLPVVTLALVALNVAVYLFIETHSVSGNGQALAAVLEMRGTNVVQGQWWRLLTSAFLQIQLMHLVGNAVFLCILGWVAERLIGHGNLLLLCITSGIAGSIAELYSFRQPRFSSFGASGVVYGLVGILLYVYVFKRGVHANKLRYRRIVLLTAFVIINLLGEWYVFGRPIPGHVGGLLAGLAFPFLIPVVGPESKVRTVVGVAGVVLCLLAVTMLAARKQKVWVELDEIDPTNLYSVDWSSIPRLQRIVNDYPENLRAHQLLAEAYQSGRRYEDAIREYRYVLSKLPLSERDWYRMGWAYLDNGNYREAIVTFTRTLELDSENPERQMPRDAQFSVRMDREALARAYEGAGRIDDAITQYKMVLELFPDDFTADQELRRLRKLHAQATMAHD